MPRILLLIEGQGENGAMVSLRWFLQWLVSIRQFEITLFHLAYTGNLTGVSHEVRQIGYPDWVAHSRFGNIPIIRAIHCPRLFFQFVGLKLIARWTSMSNALKGIFCAHREKYDVAISFADDLCNRVVGGFRASKHFGWNHEDYIAQELDERWQLATRMALAQLNGVFCVSETSRTSLYQIMGERVVPIYVFHNLLDIENVSVASAATCYSNKLHLLSVGRLCKEKRFDLIIDIARNLREKGADFVWTVVGNGEMLQCLRQQADDANLTRIVNFVGQQRDWQHIYSRDHIYVQTSSAEGWGLALEEAALAGYRCVCSDIPVFHEIADFLQTRFAYGTSSQEFADAITNVANADAVLNVNKRGVLKSYDVDKNNFLKVCGVNRN